MTILQLISSEGFYGAESMLVSLSQSLSRLGCDLVVGVFHDARNPHTEVGRIAAQQGLTVRIIPCEGRADWRAVRRIRALIDERRVHILHAHGYKADLYGFAASRLRSVALVSTCHNWPSRSHLMRMYATLDRLVLRGFERVATPSPVVEGILRRAGISSARLSWIANGVDIGRFNGAEATLRGGVRKVGFVGRLVPEKGGAVLLEAARTVIESYPEVTFVVVGDGPARKDWEDLAASLGIAEHVVFTGTHHDMPGMYASFNMLVLPSLEEAMPMCLLEAMAAGKPVIATSVGAIPKVVMPGLTGFLTAPGDSAALSGYILRLLRDPDLASQLGENGRQRAIRQFSSDRMAAQYIGLYEGALMNRSVGRRTRKQLQTSKV